MGPIRLLSADFGLFKFCEFLELCENQTICDDVISGRKWRHRSSSSTVIQDFGLKFYIFQSVLNFNDPVFLWTLWKEAYFSIFKIEKIDQNLPESNIWRLFLGNSTTLNPMSTSVFSTEEVGTFSILILSATNIFEMYTWKVQYPIY